jgi:hypothetical protein
MRWSKGREMQCSKCGEFNASGVFCTSCGNQLQTQEENSTTHLVQTKGSNKKMILIIGGISGALVVGLVGFFVLRPSPAVPYLKSACAILAPVKFEDLGSDDMKDLADQAESEIQSALAVDSALAAPFASIVPSIQESIDIRSEWSRWLSLYLSSYYSIYQRVYLSNAQDSLDELKANNIKIENTIMSVCADYK